MPSWIVRRAQQALGISLLFAVVGCLVVAERYVHAQSPRNGVRIRLGQITGEGGLSGTAFLPIPPSTVRAEPLPGTPCAGMQIVAIGRLPRGPIRAVHVVLLVTETGRAGTIGGGACPGATISFELEDGVRIPLDRGDLDLTEVDLDGGVVVARYSGTAVRDGDPVSVSGDLRLQFPGPGR